MTVSTNLNLFNTLISTHDKLRRTQESGVSSQHPELIVSRKALNPGLLQPATEVQSLFNTETIFQSHLRQEFQLLSALLVGLRSSVSPDTPSIPIESELESTSSSAPYKSIHSSTAPSDPQIPLRRYATAPLRLHEHSAANS